MRMTYAYVVFNDSCSGIIFCVNAGRVNTGLSSSRAVLHSATAAVLACVGIA